MVKRVEFPSFDLYYIKDDTNKYTVSLFGLLFIGKLTKDNLVTKKIILKLMNKSNKFYQNEKELETRLQDLYDMDLRCGSSYFGESIVLSIKTLFINNEFTNNEVDLLEEAIKIINDCVINIDFINDNQEVNIEKVQREIDLRIDEIKSFSNNKIAYAINELQKKMHENDPNNIKFELFLEEYENNNIVNDIIKSYNDLLKMKKAFFYIGNEEINKVVDKINEHVKFNDKNLESEKYQFVSNSINIKDKYDEIIVAKNINQSCLCIGYKSDITIQSKEFYAMKLISYMLGGNFNSSLFKEVREANSLAYYISSIYESRCGDFIIYAGINSKNYQKALNLIFKIINRYQQGLFTKQDIENFNVSKLAIIKDIKGTFDEIDGYISRILKKVFEEKELSKEQLIEKYNSLTIDDIKDAINHLKLDTIYLLKGDSDV